MEIKISELATLPPEGLEEVEVKKKTKELGKRLAELQGLISANRDVNVLVIFQGMDASGKDGAVKTVFKYCSAIDLHLHSFKKPSKEEAAHDFLWRAHKRTPERGQIVVWNRSHYEDVLIHRVHGWIDDKGAARRMKAINAFEELLSFDNNTIIFKFFLNISFEQQTVELRQRMNEKDKHYKHNDGDWEERKHWFIYMAAYEDVLNKCKRPKWTVVPVDKRWYRDYVMLSTMVKRLERLNLEYPPLDSQLGL